MLKLLHEGCVGLSSGISSQFTFEMCAAAKNGKKFTKSPFWGVQGRSRSSMLINLKSLSSVLVVMISSMSDGCNRFHTKRANAK